VNVLGKLPAWTCDRLLSVACNYYYYYIITIRMPTVYYRSLYDSSSVYLIYHVYNLSFHCFGCVISCHCRVSNRVCVK